MFKPGLRVVVVFGVTGAVVWSTAGSAISQDAGSAGSGPDVRISELTNGGPGGHLDNFVEIANFGDEVADLDGWAVYRCVGRANRFRDPQVPPLEDVRLAPGETYTIAHPDSTVTHLADRADAISSYANDGFGIVIEDADRNIVDAAAVYADTVHSDCTDRVPSNLPNDLDFQRAQSYQRVATTGDVQRDFIKAERTPGALNATEPDPGVQPSDVRISELTNGGPNGSSDNFIELANFGDQPVDIGAWEVWRCLAPGYRLPTYLQVTVPDGVVLEPGATFVAAHQSVEVPPGVPHAHYETSLANDGFGAMVEDRHGNIMDAVAVIESDGVHQIPMNSPCAQGTALPNRLDYGFDQTYQRFQDTGDNSADFVVAERTLGELVVPDPADHDGAEFEYGPVRISELTHSGPAGGNDNFFELANFGDESVSLHGWTVHRCQGDGRRAIESQFEAIGDVTLEPGETFLAVRAGSPLHDAGRYDAVYASGLDSDQFGVVVYDASGALVDSVGVTSHSTASVTYNACTMGVSLRNILQTDQGESFQRFQSTGDNVKDFLPAPRTPGELEEGLRRPQDFTDDELAPEDVQPRPRPLPSSLVGPQPGDEAGTDAELTVTAEHTTGDDVDVTFRGAERLEINARATQAFTGVSDEAPPLQRRPDGEARVTSSQYLDGAGEPVVVEATEGFPYQRYQLVLGEDVSQDGIELAWSGRATGRNELQMYAWNHRDQEWQLIDAAGGVHGGELTLIGTLDAATMVRGRFVDVLIQDGPATREAFSDDGEEPNLAFKDPAEYDFSWGYLTDTQYIAQSFREVNAEMIRWLVTNQDARKIAYSFHAGDIIQQWFGDHKETRARDEFDFASDLMGVLEDAGHPYGVTPGNHDNRQGRSNALYNEYFSAERYADFPWRGDTWRPDDSQNHYDVMEIGGAKFLMVYLGYFGYIDEPADDGIEWAKHVIAEHPDHNVIVTTHDYITPDGALSTPWTESEVCGDAGTSQCSRWNHLGHRYWNEVILPNENVFLVLAGHRTGVALNIKRDVGGVEGRTVIEMLANYQNFHRDGNRDTGFLRLLQIDVDAKAMAVNTYSPYLEEHNAWQYDHAAERRYDDSDDEFTITGIGLNDVYDKRVETDVLGVFGPFGDVATASSAAGAEVTATWSGLAAGSRYGWYTDSRDEGGAVARSPLWLFRTED
jgi:hypothetical protein